MAATPKPVRKRHKASEIGIEKKLKKVMPSQAKSIMKSHKKEVKGAKAKFKSLGGKY